MLVLSRMAGNGITLPDMDVSIEILKIQGNRVQVGIQAPDSVCILRSELVDRNPRTIDYHASRIEIDLIDRVEGARRDLSYARKLIELGEFEQAEQILTQMGRTQDTRSQRVSEPIACYKCARGSSVEAGALQRHALEGLAC